jgi:hypothetical protein
LVDVAERNPLPFPFDRCVRTAVVKGSLEPEWSDERFHFDDVGPALPYVRVQVMDYNGPIHKPRLLGEVDVSLEALQRLGGAHGSVAAQWYPIKNSDRELSGEVELKVDLLPSTDMDEKQLAIKDAAESRWFPDVIPDDVVDLSEGEPNCLKVAVIRAKDLRAVDDGTIGRKQSNPLVVVDVIAPGRLCDEVETLTVEDDLDPVWCQSLNAPLPENLDVRTLALRVRVIDEDEDRITKRRLMGQTAFRLDRLPKQLEEDGSSVAKWYALGPGPDDIDDDDRGEILLACRLVHEPSFIKVGESAFFSEEAIDEEMLQTPNEVRVAVLRCENLRPKISAAWRPLQRTVPQANPYVSVSVEPGDGFVQRTRTKFAELNPIFDEAFAFEIDGLSVAGAEDHRNTVVVASCYARDGVDGDDAFIGRALMPLGALAREPGQVGRAWVPLLDEQDGIVGRCLMEAQCVYDASHEFAPFDVSGDRDLGPFPPNQLSVAVFRARGVPPPPPKSYDRLAPSADVSIELQIPGGEPLQIGARQRTGAPLWRAVKTVELSAPTEYDGEHPQNNWETLQDYEIEVLLRDNDVLGRGAVPLANLCDSRPRRTFQGWVALRAPPNSEAEAHLDKWRCGVFVALHWSHNPVLHYEPFALSKSENTKQYPNELCIAVVRARGLHAPDGESNASVLLAVPTADGEDIEHEVETKARAGSEPAWKEAFFLGLEDPFLRKHPPVVQLGVRSRGMSLGRGDLPLRLGLDRRVHTEWVSLQDEGYAEEFAGGAVEVRFMLRYNEELDRFFDPHSKDRLAAAQAAKNAQQYLMQLAEDRDRRQRIAESLARDARMAAAAAERARVYLEELVEKRKETLPDVLKEDEADDGLGAASLFFLAASARWREVRERTHAVTRAHATSSMPHAIAAPRRRRRYITQASTASAPRASRTRSEYIWSGPSAKEDSGRP